MRRCTRCGQRHRRLALPTCPRCHRKFWCQSCHEYSWRPVKHGLCVICLQAVEQFRQVMRLLGQVRPPAAIRAELEARHRRRVEVELQQLAGDEREEVA